MAVDLILLENVSDLGIVGDKVRVADGYARNFLLPRKLATYVTDVNMRQLEIRKQKALQEYKDNLAVAQELGAKLAELSVVTVLANASEDDKLFGSVTNIEIAKALKENGFDIERRNILLEKAIKNLGLADFKVKVHKEVIVNLQVLVSKA